MRENQSVFGGPARRLILMLLLAFGASPVASAQEAIGPETRLARVGDREILVGEFAGRLQRQARETYWHSGVPESERAEFERTVLDGMIDRILLLGESDRRGLQADMDLVEEQVEALDARYTGQPGWDEARDRVLEAARGNLADDARLEELERRVRDVPPPDEAAVRDYYAAHPEKFTEPMKVRTSVVLLRVDPSSDSATWQAAVDRATTLRGAISEGGDFGDVAREYSDDRTAAQGGDMGFQHAGMLGEEIDRALEKMQVGEVSEPLVLLDGVALIKLTDRIEPELHPYERVAERARALLERDRSDAAWDALRSGLREQVEIVIEESLLTPLAGGEKQGD